MKKKLEFILINCLPILGIGMLFELINSKYSSFILICLFLLLLFLTNKVKYKKIDKYKKIFSIIITLFIVLGTKIDQNYDSFFYYFDDIFKVIFELYSVYIYFLYFFEAVCQKISELLDKKNVLKWNIYYSFLALFIFFLICWLPYYLNYYPGLLSPDSINQISQAVKLIPLSNHHPILHTFFIKCCIFIAKNNINIGVAVYSFLQMVILSLSFSYSICFMIKKKVNKYLVYLSTLFYGIVPIFGFYSITMWKDVIFGAASLVLFIQIYKFINNENGVLNNIVLVLSIIVTSLFRTNGLYVLIILLLIMLFYFKKNRKRVIIFIGLPVIFSFSVVSYLYPFLGISKTEFTENIGILIKQVYGTVYEDRSLAENSELFDNLVNLDDALNAYSPYTDSIKMVSSYSNSYLEENKGEFFKVWFKIGIKHPIKYIDIYLKSTYGFWYPNAQGYIVHMWNNDGESFGINYKKFDRFGISNYFTTWYNMPVIKLLLSDAFCFWFLVLGIIKSINNKKYEYLICLLLPFLIWLTLMVATPLSYQPRYSFALFTMLPQFITIIFFCSKSKGGFFNEK